MRTRSNYIQYSEQLNRSPWTLSAGSFQSSAIPGPLPNASVWNFVPDASFGVHSLVQLQGSPSTWDLIPAGVATTLSVYLAPAGISKVYIVPSMFSSWNGGGGQNFSCIIDLTTGTVAYSAPGMITTVVPAGNGWYRVSMTAVSAGPNGPYVCQFYPYLPSTNDLTGSGDGIQGFLISGVQLEIGVTATGYIPNSGSSIASVTDYPLPPVASSASVLQSTLLLDVSTWDLITDLNGNLAIAQAPYSYAQDVASAVRLFAGELWYDTTQGVPYFSEILGHSPPLTLIQARIEQAALSVPGVVSAQCVLASDGRAVTGQVSFVDVNGNSDSVSF
jgi:hypothetical protein